MNQQVKSNDLPDYVALPNSVRHAKRATNPSLAWCGIDVSNQRFRLLEPEDVAALRFCGNCRRFGEVGRERELEARLGCDPYWHYYVEAMLG
jgi:hypothetical protein